MKNKPIEETKRIAQAIDGPATHIWKIVQVFEDANLRDMEVETVLERFREVVQKCQDIEHILAEQLPALEKLAHKQE